MTARVADLEELSAERLRHSKDAVNGVEDETKKQTPNTKGWSSNLQAVVKTIMMI